MTYQAHRHREPESHLADYLAEGRRILASASAPGPLAGPSGDGSTMDQDAESLRWFPLPHEVLARLG